MIALLIFSSSLWAMPSTLAHQGRLLDATGQPLAGEHDLHVALYDDAGQSLWQEDLSAVSFEQGYFSVQLGQSTVVDLSQADAATLGLSVDGGDELSPRVNLNAVPYALIAQNVRGGGVDVSEIRVNGETLFSGSSQFTGSMDWSQLSGSSSPDLASTLLGGLGCQNDEHPALISGLWTCTVENAHGHSASDITSGVIDVNRLLFGIGGGTIAEGNHVHTAVINEAIATHIVDDHHTKYTDDAARAAVNTSLVHSLSGRYFKLYGLEITAGNNAAHVSAPHLNMTATRANRIGSASLEIVGAPHCGYCYSSGPKAVLYNTGNVSYTYYTLGGSVYLELDAGGTASESFSLQIRSSHPIAPIALSFSEFPTGLTTVMGL